MVNLTFDLTYRQLVPVATIFYDAPSPPQGMFDDFLAIPTVQKNVSSTTYNDLVASLNFVNPPSNVPTRLAEHLLHSNSKAMLTR
jgi:hypothetical protein